MPKAAVTAVGAIQQEAKAAHQALKCLLKIVKETNVPRKMKDEI